MSPRQSPTETGYSIEDGSDDLRAEFDEEFDEGVDWGDDENFRADSLGTGCGRSFDICCK